MAIALIAALAVTAQAGAYNGGGHGGSGHGGGGHAGGFGFHGGGGGGYGGFHAGYGYHGGYGYRGGFGYGGGYGGRYGRWYGGYGYGAWGWAGYGLFLSTLPYYYSTYWWDGVPYYYADDNYYRWDGSLGEYEVVNPPAGLANQDVQPANTELYAYPRNGQSTQQQAQDKQQCQTWADSQSGVDSTQSQTGHAAASIAAASSPTHRPDYLRAQAACLEGRGYSVR
jgi:hypothetical protein